MESAGMKHVICGSLETYDEHAYAQKIIAGHLWELADKDRKYGNVLEIGCGSGNLTRLAVSLDCCMYVANDICEGAERMLHGKIHDAGKIRFVCGDAEALPFDDLSRATDLILSASVIQWFKDIPAFFRKMASLLSPGGEILLSSFGKDNFRQIRSLTGKGLDYMSKEQLSGIARDCGLEVMDSFEEKIEMAFDSPYEVLRHIKLTGIGLGTSAGWTRSRMEGFSRAYAENFGTGGGGVSLTYAPVYLKAAKP